MRMLPLLITFTLLAAGISYAFAADPLDARGSTLHGATSPISRTVNGPLQHSAGAGFDDIEIPSWAAW
jgi:hypothetical protein